MSDPTFIAELRAQCPGASPSEIWDTLGGTINGVTVVWADMTWVQQAQWLDAWANAGVSYVQH
jgi:hypothetical protein